MFSAVVRWCAVRCVLTRLLPLLLPLLLPPSFFDDHILKRFQNLDPSIQNIFHRVALASMTCIAHEYVYSW